MIVSLLRREMYAGYQSAFAPLDDDGSDNYNSHDNNTGDMLNRTTIASTASRTARVNLIGI